MIRPVSWVGKKPFGICMNRTMVSASAARKTRQHAALVKEGNVERALVSLQQRIKDAFNGTIKSAVAGRFASHEA